MRSTSSSARTVACLLLLTVAVPLVEGGEVLPAQAQSSDDLHPRRVLAPTDTSPRLPTVRHRALQRETAGPVSTPNASPRFGDALVGSAIGTAVGGPLGGLLIREANDDAFWEDRKENNPDNCCGLQRLGLALLGMAAVAGAGPYGAAQRLDQGGAAFYAASVSGELLLGGLGYALGSALGGEDRRVVGGLALGLPLAAIGAAGGAVLNARMESFRRRPGGLRFQGDEWHVGMPAVRVRPSLGRGRRPAVHVTFFSAQID